MLNCFERSRDVTEKCFDLQPRKIKRWMNLKGIGLWSVRKEHFSIFMCVFAGECQSHVCGKSWDIRFVCVVTLIFFLSKALQYCCSRVYLDDLVWHSEMCESMWFSSVGLLRAMCVLSWVTFVWWEDRNAPIILRGHLNLLFSCPFSCSYFVIGLFC